MARLQEEGVLSNGKKVGYGLGLAWAPTVVCAPFLMAAADAGYRSYVVWFPDEELGIAIASNLESFDPGHGGEQGCRGVPRKEDDT